MNISRNKIIYSILVIVAVLIATTAFASSFLTLHTGQTTNYRAGDDQSNDGTAKSYTADGCGTGTVLDDHTGLCWQYDDQSKRIWNDAIDYCAALTLASHSDWRLPTMYEGATMFDYQCGSAGGSCADEFQNNALDWATSDPDAAPHFWLSTSVRDPTYDDTYAYIALTTSGGMNFDLKATKSFFVRCVRSAN